MVSIERPLRIINENWCDCFRAVGPILTNIASRCLADASIKICYHYVVSLETAKQMCRERLLLATLREPSPPNWESLETETVKYDESRWTGTPEWLRWREPAPILNYRPILSSERLLHKDYDRKGSIEKNAGRESREAWRQDQLIYRKTPVVKQLWLWLWGDPIRNT
jgi:hypothetical protein